MAPIVDRRRRGHEGGRMRAVVQRVTSAAVTVTHDNGSREETGRIGRGLMVLVGATHEDDTSLADRLADKLAKLRIFADEGGKMNKSVIDVEGEVLVVSQFTLYGDARKGNRPSFVAAARPEQAEPLVDRVVERLRRHGLTVATGRFRTDMAVELVNDGPVTIVVDLP